MVSHAPNVNDPVAPLRGSSNLGGEVTFADQGKYNTCLNSDFLSGVSIKGSTKSYWSVIYHSSGNKSDSTIGTCGALGRRARGWIIYKNQHTDIPHSLSLGAHVQTATSNNAKRPLSKTVRERYIGNEVEFSATRTDTL
jgi:hypothetical protein